MKNARNPFENRNVDERIPYFEEFYMSKTLNKSTQYALSDSLNRLLEWIKKNGWEGYDPYDALNSPVINFLTFKNKNLRFTATQIIKFLPIDLRRLLSTQKSIEPKGVGLFASGYLKLYKSTDDKKFLTDAQNCLRWLDANSTLEYSGKCWGLSFDYQSRKSLLLKFQPSVVVTSTVANAFLDGYDITQDKEYLKIARSSCDFVLKELNITERPEGTCFSYTPFDRDLCHNANLLGAELLSRIYSITREETLLEYAKKAFDFTLYHQNPDGSWDYSIDPQTGKGRKQIDFHQGFVIDSIFSFIKNTKPSDDKYIKSLLKGAEFYKNEQFLPDGRCKYRWPKVYPSDIHHQAQGIITFSKLSEIKTEYLEFAKTIAKWTIKNMQDESGYFYYRRYKFFTNKIPYMRWGQAWMMRALASLLEAMENGRK